MCAGARLAGGCAHRGGLRCDRRAALTRRRVPLMLVGTANSSSVAEHALFLMLALAKRGGRARRARARWPLGRAADRAADRPSRQDRARRRLRPHRHARRQALPGDGDECASSTIRTCRQPACGRPDASRFPISMQRLPRADFVTIHCPKTAETLGMFGAARLAAHEKDRLSRQHRARRHRRRRQRCTRR